MCGSCVLAGPVRPERLLPEHLAPVVLQVFGLWARRLGWKGQWLAFVGLEVLAHGRLDEMVAERRGTDKA